MYCRVLGVTRQAFYSYLKHKDDPRKNGWLEELITDILEEDECNDTYGRRRMHEALTLRHPDRPIPGERTVYRIMERMGVSHAPRRKPNGITRADREARKSDDLIKRDFTSGAPLEKCVTDITEVPCADGKLYISAIFDCFDAACLGIAIDTNMRASLCVRTLRSACLAYPGMRGSVIHSDRGSQYTSAEYRDAVKTYGITQSMNSGGGRCHDNARCESFWARLKEELLYGRHDTGKMTMDEVGALIWRYFMGYWNNRRICSANGGLPPMEKRARYYASLGAAA